LYSAFEPDEDWPSFPTYLDQLAVQAPHALRTRFLRHMFPRVREQHQVLAELDTFLAHIDRREFDQEIERDLFAEAHALLNDPPALRATIVSHLAMMWQEHLASEWERSQPFLRDAAEVLRRHATSDQNAYDAIRSVTGRAVEGRWYEVLAPAETLIFIPSRHVGPYMLHVAYPPMVRILFGPRLPQGMAHGPGELSRADLLVQLRALADETRLRILGLLDAEGELCAQEIIARLDLTKSSASRHLSQLSASGYLAEYQRAGKTKCYTLNPGRFRETLDVLERYAQT
ncbi:MAG TPA: metalloregulator ArsR/SmtB family transcription factor, partial [Ardenticatenaceae bacterium]|nr:metalloregulator ArsR/SmtB family transcription factor [Ardenticatenaceae bacterium]